MITLIKFKKPIILPINTTFIVGLSVDTHKLFLKNYWKKLKKLFFKGKEKTISIIHFNEVVHIYFLNIFLLIKFYFIKT